MILYAVRIEDLQSQLKLVIMKKLGGEKTLGCGREEREYEWNGGYKTRVDTRRHVTRSFTPV